MSQSQNWRPPTNGVDYLQSQSKQMAMNNRRPGMRVADVVGPGIQAQATSLNDFNDPLGTFNGSYFANGSAANPPELGAGFSYMVEVYVDSVVGGWQFAYPLERPGRVYRRYIPRLPGAPDVFDYSQLWQLDTGASSPSVQSINVGNSAATPAGSGGIPKWSFHPYWRSDDWGDFYGIETITYLSSTYTDAGLRIKKPGLYSLDIQVTLGGPITDWSYVALVIEKNTIGSLTQAVEMPRVSPTAYLSSSNTHITFKCNPAETRLLYLSAQRGGTGSQNVTLYLNNLSRIGN